MYLNFCFSILGMNLFGCKFCKNEDIFVNKPITTLSYDNKSNDNNSNISIIKRCERKNFDSLLWALVTVFQVSFNTIKLYKVKH